MQTFMSTFGYLVLASVDPMDACDLSSLYFPLIKSILLENEHLLDETITIDKGDYSREKVEADGPTLTNTSTVGKQMGKQIGSLSRPTL